MNKSILKTIISSIQHQDGNIIVSMTPKRTQKHSIMRETWCKGVLCSLNVSVAYLSSHSFNIWPTKCNGTSCMPFPTSSIVTGHGPLLTSLIHCACFPLARPVFAVPFLGHLLSLDMFTATLFFDIYIYLHQSSEALLPLHAERHIHAPSAGMPR
jgi:hypothetical protein